MKSIFITITLFLSLLCTGQSYVKYTYDNAGNRTARKIINMSVQQHVKGNNTLQQTDSVAVVKDMLGERTISVYPNPTRGQLGVDIRGGDEKETLAIALYNGQGALLYNGKANTGYNTVDMTDYVPGWYIMRITARTGTTEYKIIKE